MSKRSEQLAFDLIMESVRLQRRTVRGTLPFNNRIRPEWSEERERAWREHSAVKTVLTTHVIDNPCKMGKQHYGGCWHNVPEFDEFIAEIHRKRLDDMRSER